MVKGIFALTFGERLLLCRRSAGLSQHEMAALAHVSVSALCKWERGEAEPRPLMRQSIERVMQRLEDEPKARAHEYTPEAPLSTRLSRQPNPSTIGGSV